MLVLVGSSFIVVLKLLQVEKVTKHQSHLVVPLSITGNNL